MKKIVFIALHFMVASCLFNDLPVPDQEKGGIVLTFDDQYIDEWYAFKEKFREYHIKATFFISRPQNLTENQITRLKELNKEGHEVGCHGLNHRNALDFTDTENQYYLNEVEPATDILESHGFRVHSFAYPFGSSTEKTDSSLEMHVKYIRKATWNRENTTIDNYDEIFAHAHNYRNVSSMGMDINYRITLDNLATAMERAIACNEVLVLHAHRIDTTQEDYTISPDYLENVFRLIDQYGLESLRMSDLEKFFSKDSG